MPRKQTAKVTETSTDAEPLIMLTTEGAATNDERVEDKIRSEFNKSDEDVWAVKVSRYLGNGKAEIECFDCSPDDFPITERIREEHGAGNYRVRVWKNSRLAHFFQYAIEASKRNPTAEVKSEIATLAQSFQAALDRQSQMIERLVAGQSKGGNGGGNTMKDMAETLVLLKGLVPTPEKSSRSELLEIFKLGMSAASGGSETPSDGGGILGFAERLLNNPVIQKIAEAATSALPPTAPPPAQLSAPRAQTNGATRVEGDVAANQAQDQQAAVENFMRQQVLYLMGRAANYRRTIATTEPESHPDLYAEWVLDNIPRPILDPLMATPDPVGTLAGFVPEVAQFQDWFAALVGAIRSELTGEGDPPDNGATVAANGRDARPYVPSAPGADTSRPS